MVEKMMKSIEEKYGNPFQEWVDIVKSSGLEKHGEMMKLLKSEYGFTHGFANLVVHKARESHTGPPKTSDLIDAQYGKGKEGLRLIYNALVKEIMKFGKDVELAPKKTYVSLRRTKQFGLIQPSTKTRLDIGINNKGKDTTDRLEASGSFNAMVSHRVRIIDTNQVDTELIKWLKEAYEKA